MSLFCSTAKYNPKWFPTYLVMACFHCCLQSLIIANCPAQKLPNSVSKVPRVKQRKPFSPFLRQSLMKLQFDWWLINETASFVLVYFIFNFLQNSIHKFQKGWECFPTKQVYFTIWQQIDIRDGKKNRNIEKEKKFHL